MEWAIVGWLLISLCTGYFAMSVADRNGRSTGPEKVTWFLAGLILNFLGPLLALWVGRRDPRVR